MDNNDLPTDDTLTSAGLRAGSGGNVLVLGCGALAREMLAVIDANGLDHVDVRCLPARLQRVVDDRVVRCWHRLIVGSSGQRARAQPTDFRESSRSRAIR